LANVHFGSIQVAESDGHWQFEVQVYQVYLDELSPDAIHVELFADALDGGKPLIVPMTRQRAIPGTLGGFFFHAAVSSERPAEHYTPRIVPWHCHALVPAEESSILWQRR
jgi:starch phosphorylase